MNFNQLENGFTFWTYVWKSLGTAINLAFDLIPFTMFFVLLKRSHNKLVIPTLAITMSCYAYFFGYLISFQECISIRCVPYYSSGKTKEFSKYFYRLLLINLLFLSLSVICVIFSKSILLTLNIDPDIVKGTSSLLLNTLAAKIIENLNNIFKGLLISQDQFKNFYWLNIISVCTFGLSMYITIDKMDMELGGFAISFTIKGYSRIWISADCYPFEGG